MSGKQRKSRAARKARQRAILAKQAQPDNAALSTQASLIIGVMGLGALSFYSVISLAAEEPKVFVSMVGILGFQMFGLEVLHDRVFEPLVKGAERVLDSALETNLGSAAAEAVSQSINRWQAQEDKRAAIKAAKNAASGSHATLFPSPATSASTSPVSRVNQLASE